MAVSFEEEQFSRPSQPQGKSDLATWLVRNGYADSAQKALQLQLVVAVLLIVASLVVLYVSFSKPALSSQDRRMKVWMETGHHGIPPDSFMPL